ncbi:hypothetical protein BJ875DRAFT_168726 [Amylocarpus encephaloides]|uniref:Uncharacterized protein n=1 Tax=Amylocarpus encephaloides TaxID=45428 RepID=A0A9P7YP66_9HELO|nr:hypothetical protein BJ875DRAFT_168726 [Amylocarpus encephaloides]
MCYYRRYLHRCHHFHSWGKVARACRLQQIYHDGADEEFCREKWAHPAQTIALPCPCGPCGQAEKAENEQRLAVDEAWKKQDEELAKKREKQREKQDDTLSKIKENFEDAKKRMQKWEKLNSSGSWRPGSNVPSASLASPLVDNEAEASTRAEDGGVAALES